MKPRKSRSSTTANTMKELQVNKRPKSKSEESEAGLSSKQSFPFLQLPLELRIRIYESLIPTQQCIRISCIPVSQNDHRVHARSHKIVARYGASSLERRGLPRGELSNICQINQQVLEEARDLFYRNNTFVFVVKFPTYYGNAMTSPCGFMRHHSLMNHVGGAALRRMRRVELHIVDCMATWFIYQGVYAELGRFVHQLLIPGGGRDEESEAEKHQLESLRVDFQDTSFSDVPCRCHPELRTWALGGGHIAYGPPACRACLARVDTNLTIYQRCLTPLTALYGVRGFEITGNVSEAFAEYLATSVRREAHPPLSQGLLEAEPWEVNEGHRGDNRKRRRRKRKQ
ncbi:hypothetical protein BP5796_13102 [Coleophoma crateriformis]|uniref:F-box domain-containing protein n=1 Tax=Coleophoma crateriformis TaxID=565419 RepID=A0A3D8Q4L9_9HELO|nr:hypothetical protein BP5796_13102 [Coleophoma crateriformis]